MDVAVIIPAAGAGTRFGAGDALAGGGPSKVEIDLGGRPVFLRSIELFLKRPQVRQVLLAVNPDGVDEFKFKWGDKLAFHDIRVVPGGQAERWQTVQRALEAVEQGVTHVAVHDAARPLASRRLVDRVFEAAERFDAVVPGLDVANTLKRVEPAAQPEANDADPLDAILGAAGKTTLGARRVIETVNRTDLVEVQTPQVFEVGLLRRAYAQITDGKLDASAITDDAGLVEALGEPVYVVEGEVTNLKITRPADAEFALALVRQRDKKDATALAKKRLFVDED